MYQKSTVLTFFQHNHNVPSFSEGEFFDQRVWAKLVGSILVDGLMREESASSRA